ncbi:MAG: MBOAT family protein [Chitinophagales bacterium]|nr:MBOAT family protein [Chitinophagales bacterium]
MLFNSIDFAVFLPVVFIFYWFFTNNNIRLQNLLIVAASYIFYGWWDWRFLSLIFFSTVVDYSMGILLSKEDSGTRRKIYLWVSILINIGLLGFFKYYNFFLDNFISAFRLFGIALQARSLQIILPVGISFYTFQTLSYTIDVFRRKLEPTRDLIAFAAFVSFFPQLVAGPIERASNLLPQFYERRHFDLAKATDGMRQILWGLFKKIVIADNCAEFANQIFNNSADMNGSTLALGALFFTFQIYGDFSGYSDIAIGTSRLFGFDLMRNFAFPYFSRDIAEFWRRWHISLSTWFRDYLYIPLGGSRGGRWMKVRNTFAIFLVSGFWHGANWTFLVWGGLNALYFLPLQLTNSNRTHLDTVAKGKSLPSFRELLQMLITFVLVMLAWIFFRSNDLGHAIQYLSTLFSSSFFSGPSFPEMKRAWSILLLVVVFLAVEWRGREHQYAIAYFHAYRRRGIRWTLYLLICLLIFLYQGSQQDFIYFQF